MCVYIIVFVLISNIVITHVLYYDTTLFYVKPKNSVKACIRVSVGVSTAYLYIYNMSLGLHKLNCGE